MSILSNLGRGFFRKASRPNKIDRLYEAAMDSVEAGDLRSAETSLRKAIELEPTNLIITNELALTLSKLGQGKEAHQLWERAVQLDDCFVPAVVNLATVLANIAQQTSRAGQLARRAIRLDPFEGHADAVLAQVELKEGLAADASRSALHAWLKNFDNPELSSAFLFVSSHNPELSEQDLAAEHAFWGATQANPERESFVPERRRELKSNKIRIGYISGDLKTHSLAYFILPVLENHSDRFETYIYSLCPTEDEVTGRARACAHLFRSLSSSSTEQIRRVIASDDLDILVELSGHTNLTAVHLLNDRVARRQISAFGYPPTTGSRSIDYKVVDERLSPLATEQLYTEELIRLPQVFWTFAPINPTPPPAPPPCLQSGIVVFGYFGSLAKLNHDVLKAWALIQDNLPNCRIAVKSVHFLDPNCIEAFNNRACEAKLQVARLDLLPPDPPEQLFDSYRSVDIILDSYPYSGGTTSCFALWMGVPVITLKGSSSLSRMGGSMLELLGLGELACNTWAMYVEAATKLAREPDKLERIRAELRERIRSCSLGNAEMFMRDYEDAMTSLLTREPTRPSTLQLPVSTIAERIGHLISYRQYDAAQRIIKYARDLRPSDPNLLTLHVELLAVQGRFRCALSVLSSAEQEANDEGLLATCASLHAQCSFALRAYPTAHEMAGIAGKAAGLETELATKAALIKSACKLVENEDVLGESDVQLQGLSLLIVAPMSGPQKLGMDESHSCLLNRIFSIPHRFSTNDFLRSIEKCQSKYIALVNCSYLPSTKALADALHELDHHSDVVGPCGSFGDGPIDSSGMSVTDTVGVRISANKFSYDAMLYGKPNQRVLRGASALRGELVMFKTESANRAIFEDELYDLPLLQVTAWTRQLHQNGCRVSVMPELACAVAEEDVAPPIAWATAARILETEQQFAQLMRADRLSQEQQRPLALRAAVMSDIRALIASGMAD